MIIKSVEESLCVIILHQNSEHDCWLMSIYCKHRLMCEQPFSLPIFPEVMCIMERTKKNPPCSFLGVIPLCYEKSKLLTSFWNNHSARKTHCIVTYPVFSNFGDSL